MKRAILLIVLVAWAVFAIQQAAIASGPTGRENGPILQATTTPAPTSPTASAAQGGVSPLVGVLVLLAPAVWMVWKSGNAKQAPRIITSCCLPVIDEKRLPKSENKSSQ